MLRAVARMAPEAQLAWEAPMACGFGACYGCVVELGGHLRRLCMEGPVLRGQDVLAAPDATEEAAAA
jgi:dihydroorotate dehydrogenase electron transfer subunit